MIEFIATNFVDFTSPHTTSGMAQTPSIQALRVAISCFLRTMRMLQVALQLGIAFCTRVLGVYRANVVYTGPGMHDYGARRLEFLWVRWYQVVDPDISGWSSSRLDSVRFPPMNEEDAFGFVDPKDALRTCHIIPNFAKGKRYADGAGVSRCAKDAGDYCQYYIGRYVPRCRAADSNADLRHLGFLSGIFL